MLKNETNLSSELSRALRENFQGKLLSGKGAWLKADASVVTEVDLFISDYFKNKFQQDPELKAFRFHSEEEHQELAFPAVLLDPIDGTKDFVLGNGECAVSLALMQSPVIAGPDNFAWIFNFFTGFELSSSSMVLPALWQTKKKLTGMVSRTEMKGGLFDRFESLGNICLIEKGSIALKLGLLAAGACDFVVSLEHKNIWDIAAGCILASQRGMGFYHNGQLVTSLTEQSYTGVLLWARHEHVEQLNSIFLSS